MKEAPRRPLRSKALEAVIDDIAASYDGPEGINNLESAALPNRRAVIEAYEHICPVLFMGFYSRRALNRDNLRYSLSENLYPAFEILSEQIARAITYEDWQGRCLFQRPPGWSEDVVLEVFKQLPRTRRVLDQDVKAAYLGDPAARSFEEIVFSYPGLQAITAYRFAHLLYEAQVPMIPRIISEHAHSLTGIDINAGARIGPGFFVDHGTGVVIGETTDIGAGVKLYQGVTLGALSVRREAEGPITRPKKRHPTIEDAVTVYAGATILGGSTVIGAGSVIGGNVFLTKSVPPGSKVFGRGRESVPPAATAQPNTPAPPTDVTPTDG